jgi:hypothetical protein
LRSRPAFRGVFVLQQLEGIGMTINGATTHKTAQKQPIGRPFYRAKAAIQQDDLKEPAAS